MRRRILLAGIAAVLATSAVWHGPLGAGERMAARAETIARQTLDYYELPMIEAQMQRAPMARRLMLSGPADDFQRAELIRILDQIPGVLEVRWQGSRQSLLIPQAIEAQLIGVVGFLFGLLIAYIAELRRRANRWKRRI
ncbi:MAG TPA: hypothetical protein VNA29_06475 [Sphingomicrobium sp.]|nr:hypothetical protein [Sphingomicrobium sp.]